MQVVSIIGLIDKFDDYLAAASVLTVLGLINPFKCYASKRKRETKEMENTSSFGISSLSLKAFKFNRKL